MLVKEKIVAMYEDGIQWYEIGERLNLKEKSLKNYRLRITKYHHRKDEFQALRNEGMTLVEIAERTGVPEETISILTKHVSVNVITKRRKEKEAKEKHEKQKLKDNARKKYYIDHNEPLSGRGELPQFLQGIGPVKISGKPHRMAGVPEHIHGKQKEGEPKMGTFYVSKKFQ